MFDRERNEGKHHHREKLIIQQFVIYVTFEGINENINNGKTIRKNLL